MNLFRDFQAEVAKVVEDLGEEGLLPKGLDLSRVACEPAREAAHGDVATNAAMVLAKPAGKNPRDLAALLAQRLGTHHAIEKAVVAGPGFINLTLARSFWHGRLRDALEAGRAYGDSNLGAGRRVNVEYVSANPTGPMHVGHARGAVVGDVLARLLAKAGFTVTKEYYVNDAGAQLEALARSVYYRYREALGEDVGPIPDGLYPGDYLKDVGHALAKRDGEKWLGVPEVERTNELGWGVGGWREECANFGRDQMMDLIKRDLASLAVVHDVFSYERDLHRTGKVQAAYDLLKDRGLIYRGVLEPPKGMKLEDWEPREQDLFRSSRFGDDVDRPLKKSDGSWTYFAADVAYHLDKHRRGAAIMIDVWGADHGGYVKRVAAAVEALTGVKGALDVKLCQLVSLTEGGEPVRMSKRAGTFVTLADVVDAVGKDVVRFIMLTRSNDMALEFDLKKVLEQTRDNPVFYVQYAHARACSVCRHALAEKPGLVTDAARLAAVPLDSLTAKEEIDLIRLMAGWPRVVENAAEAHEPHRVAYYLHDLAAAFHGLWNKGNAEADARFLVEDDATAQARLALVRGLQLVIASGLDVLGVTPVEEMR